jgi:hypothetical protein
MSIRYFSCSCHLQLDKICPHDNDPFNARRMRTDWTVADFSGLSKTQVERINASNQRYNDLAEGIEELNMEIAMRQIDDGTYDKPASKPKKRKSKKASTKELFEDCPEDVLADLMEDGFDLQ